MITEPLPSPYWTLPSGRTFPSDAARRGAGPPSRSDWLKADSYVSMGRAVRSRIIGRIGVFASSADAARSVAVHARPSTPTAMSVLTMTTPLKARERIAPAPPFRRGLRPRPVQPLHPAGNRGVGGSDGHSPRLLLRARERIAPAPPFRRWLRPRSDYPLNPAGNRWGVSGGAALAPPDVESIVRDQRVQRVLLQFLAPVKERQLDHERHADHAPAELLDEPE